jgi:hypothetical protein
MPDYLDYEHYELKLHEQRVRGRLNRRGLRLVKNRARNPYAIGYGHYVVVDARTNKFVFPRGGSRWVSLDAVEEWAAA